MEHLRQSRPGPGHDLPAHVLKTFEDVPFLSEAAFLDRRRPYGTDISSGRQLDRKNDDELVKGEGSGTKLSMYPIIALFIDFQATT